MTFGHLRIGKTEGNFWQCCIPKVHNRGRTRHFLFLLCVLHLQSDTCAVTDPVFFTELHRKCDPPVGSLQPVVGCHKAAGCSCFSGMNCGRNEISFITIFNRDHNWHILILNRRDRNNEINPITFGYSRSAGKANIDIRRAFIHQWFHALQPNHRFIAPTFNRPVVSVVTRNNPGNQPVTGPQQFIVIQTEHVVVGSISALLQHNHS